MRTAKEFNEKYEQYLEEGFDGMQIIMPSIIHYVDQIFQDLIKIEGFKYRH